METMKSKWLVGTCQNDESNADTSSSINTSGDVLTFTDLSGVFYCVLFGMACSLLVLLVELFVEAHKDTKQNQKEARVEALKRRVWASWRAYQGPGRTITSSVDPEDASRCFQTRDCSNSAPRMDSTNELVMDDITKKKNGELNGFKGKEIKPRASPSHRRSSLV